MPKFQVGDSLFRIRSGTIKKFDETHTRWEPDFVLQPVTVENLIFEKYSIPQYNVRVSPTCVVSLFEVELMTREEAFAWRLKGMKSA
jgi:hypothetical protein